MESLAPGALRARRLGLYGGSFDPPHAGHVYVARSARLAFDLEHVLFVPAARPPHKLDRRLVDGAHRLELLRRCLADEETASIWAGELHRAGPSYTIDTVRTLRRMLAPETEMFLLIGSDNLCGLARWHAVDELMESVQPIVVERRARAARRSGPTSEEGRRSQAGQRGRGDWERACGDLDQLASSARSKLRAGRLVVRAHPASSTDLRRRLAETESDSADARFRDELKPSVLEYIRAHRLYGDG